MSTYHVAFAVSKYESVESKSGDGIVFRSWYKKDRLNLVKYVSELGPKMLDHFGEILGVKYPMPSIDLMVLPDYDTGATENYGHVMFQARSMLYDDKLLNLAEKNEISRWLAFELAHMWFGNLVTMNWWNDLWLNEALSVYFMLEGVDVIAPGETRDLDRFQILRIHPSLYGLDGSNYAPILSPDPSKVNTEYEIDYMFRYAQEEGACLVKMMEAFLGGNNMLRGLQAYLKKFKFGNTVQDDLFKNLQEVAADIKPPQVELPTDLKIIMDSWTTQPGYPLVTVKRNYKDNTATAKQERFFETFKPAEGSKNKIFWLPITYRSSNGEESEWMGKSELTFTPKVPSDEPLIVNNDQTAYYRVDYDLKNWNLITKLLKKDHTKITFKDRAKLYDDSYSLLLSDDVDIMPLATWRKLHDNLKNEREYVPWTAAVKNLHHFLQLVRFQPSLKKEAVLVRAWILDLILPTFKELGYSTRKGDVPFQIWLRQRLMHMLCNCDYEECTQEMVKQFNNWKGDGYEVKERDNPIDPEYRVTVYCYGFYDGINGKKRNEWFEKMRDKAKEKVWDYEYERRRVGAQCQTRLSIRKNAEKETRKSENHEDRVLRQRQADVDPADYIFNRQMLEAYKSKKNILERYKPLELTRYEAELAKAEHRLDWIEKTVKIVKEVFKN